MNINQESLNELKNALEEYLREWEVYRKIRNEGIEERLDILKFLINFFIDKRDNFNEDIKEINHLIEMFNKPEEVKGDLIKRQLPLIENNLKKIKEQEVVRQLREEVMEKKEQFLELKGSELLLIVDQIKGKESIDGITQEFKLEIKLLAEELNSKVESILKKDNSLEMSNLKVKNAKKHVIENSNLFGEESFRVESYDTYFRIAKTNLESASSIHKTIPNISLTVEENVNLYQQVLDFVITSIVFSALTAEAFINSYAISKESRNYFDNYLDKMNTISKYVVIPKVFTGESIDTNSQGFELLKKLFKDRDKLVHFKSKNKAFNTVINLTNIFDEILGLDSESSNSNKEKLEKIQKDILKRFLNNMFIVSSEDAQNGVIAVQKIVKALKAIDNEIEIEWVN